MHFVFRLSSIGVQAKKLVGPEISHVFKIIIRIAMTLDRSSETMQSGFSVSEEAYKYSLKLSYDDCDRIRLLPDLKIIAFVNKCCVKMCKEAEPGLKSWSSINTSALLLGFFIDLLNDVQNRKSRRTGETGEMVNDILDGSTEE
ncbi:hypothetical protein AAES_92012 [Amazona aestiva]|uniref:Uncharacterized protein n=1 Tax=Amazona aestiva TaxID=12930 RepID=A0A0Q3PWU6_AMAAE|nr:hypothetical protein AAES_92012 [Amazona aestiva]